MTIQHIVPSSKQRGAQNGITWGSHDSHMVNRLKIFETGGSICAAPLCLLLLVVVTTFFCCQTAPEAG
jgi:hypothetical protein